MLRSSTGFCVFALIISTFFHAGAASAAKICNQTPLRVFASLGYFESKSSGWEKVGWYTLGAGGCVNVSVDSRDFFYFYAEIDQSDLVSGHFFSGKYHWAGSEENKLDVGSCLRVREFHDNWDVCYSPNRVELFRRVDVSGDKDFVYRLTSEEVNSKIGFPIESLEQAREVRHLVMGQILYRRSIENDPKGTPYRIGIDVLQDDGGVFIHGVSPGLPAYGILLPGDRIVGFNGAPVRNSYDLIFSIQEHAYSSSPEERVFEFYLYRYDPASDEWRPSVAHVDAAYFRELDDRLSAGGSVDAAATAAINGATFGLFPYLYCAGDFLWDRFVNEKPDHQVDDDCIESTKRNRSMRYEQYANVSSTFDFASSFFSPRLVAKVLARRAARRSIGGVAVAMLDEGLQSAVYEYTWSTNGSSLPKPEVVEGIIQGMVIGGGVHLALGR